MFNNHGVRGSPMAQIRYGARDNRVKRALEHEAPGAMTSAQAVTVVYETDPELVAAVLPKPLKPGAEPLVRITISSVAIPGLPTITVGWIGVPAIFGDRVGEYPLFMPNTAEWSVLAGRETYGEPKKLADVWVKRDGDQVEAGVARMGYTICEIRGRVNEKREPYTKEKLDFWIKCQPSVEGVGFESDPVLLCGPKTEEARVFEGIDGDLILKDSPFDPVADLVVRRIVDINWSERVTTPFVGQFVCKLDPEDVLPYVHQRYDDLTALGKKH
jgi:acetoacetate decarboxylase